VVKLVTVILKDHQYEMLVEMGREEKLMPSQVLVKIWGTISRSGSRCGRVTTWGYGVTDDRTA